MPSDWKYESRSQRRRRVIAELQAATQRAARYVQQGDYAGARRALYDSDEPELLPTPTLTRRQQPDASGAADYARAATRAVDAVGLGLLGANRQPTPEPKKKSGFLSSVGSALDKLTPDALEGPAKATWASLDKPREYTLGPASAIYTGTIAKPTKINPETGERYREGGTVKDFARGLGKVFTQNPLDTYREAKLANDERFRDPDMSAGERFLLSTSQDPLTFVGGLGLGKAVAARAIPTAVRQAPAARLAAEVLKPVATALTSKPGRATGGALLGGAAGAEIADRADLGPGGQFLATGIGSLAGGGLAAGKRPRADGPPTTAIAGDAIKPVRIGARAEEMPWDDAVERSRTGLTPDYRKATIFTLPELRQRPLTGPERLMNTVRRTVMNKPVLSDEVAYPAMEARERLKPVIDSQASRLAVVVEDIAREAFPDREINGRIQGLPGSPTIQDVAARLPDFEPFLQPSQVQGLRAIEAELTPYRELLEQAGVKFGRRADVQDGGFYMPRGSADLEGIDAPRSTGAPKKAGGRAGFQKSAEFESMMQALDEGYTYAPLAEAIEGYGRQAGKQAIDSHVAAYFKNLVDEDGYRVASTASDRMDPSIRGRWMDATSEVMKLRGKLRTAEKRGRIAIKQGDEVDRAIDEFDRAIPEDGGARQVAKAPAALRQEAARGERLAARAETAAGDKPRRKMTAGGPVRVETPATEAEMARARIYDARAEEVARVVGRIDELLPEDADRLRFLDTAMSHTERRLNALEARGGKYKLVAQHLRRELEGARRQVDEIRPDYQAAVEKSRATPRGYASIEMAPLNGRSFPAAMADVANKYLRAEKPTSGAKAGVVNAVTAFNSLSRGLRATMDLSFMGIQGAIGMARSPIAYGKALAVAVKSLRDETVLGEFMRNFDDRAIKAGRPTSRDWAAHGLHIGGTKTEFEIGQGIGKIGDAIQGGNIPKTKLNPVRGSNRAFGNFGDALRIQLADTAYGSSKLFGFDMTQAKNLESVADAANSATGWSRTRFAGDVGEMGMFAPRFFQSQLDFLTTAAAGRGPGAVEARRMLGQFVGLGVGVTVMANVAQEDGIPLEEVFDLDSGNFMRFRFGGQDVSVFGPWDSLVRGIVNTAKDGGDPRSFYRGKSSPIVSAAWDILSGKDFRGEELSPGRVLANLVTPFSISDSALVGGDKGLAPTAVGMTGLKATAMTPTEELNALARATLGANFYDLTPSQRKTIKDAHPDIWERAVERKDKVGQQWEEVKQEHVAQQEGRDADLLEGRLTVQQWTDARKTAMAEKAGQYKAIYGDKDFPRRDKILGGYFDAIDASTRNGVVDWDAVDAYRAGLSEADSAHIDRETGIDATPVEKLRKKLAREYYELPQYRGFDADTGSEINALLQEVSNTARGDDDIYRLRALRKLVAEGGWSEAAVKGARRSILGLLNEARDRERYARAHPELALLNGRGKLTPERVRAILEAAKAA